MSDSLDNCIAIFNDDYINRPALCTYIFKYLSEISIDLFYDCEYSEILSKIKRRDKDAMTAIHNSTFPEISFLILQGVIIDIKIDEDGITYVEDNVTFCDYIVTIVDSTCFKKYGSDTQERLKNIKKNLSKETKLIATSAIRRSDFNRFSIGTKLSLCVSGMEISSDETNTLNAVLHDVKEADSRFHYVSVRRFLSDEKTYEIYARERKRTMETLYPDDKNKSANSEGCYIATSVYGSYDCPEVWTLRRYRDQVLYKSFCGRAFIKVYYLLSPTFVALFGHTKWFQKLWKKPLDEFVRKLRNQGFECTKYNDK